MSFNVFRPNWLCALVPSILGGVSCVSLSSSVPGARSALRRSASGVGISSPEQRHASPRTSNAPVDRRRRLLFRGKQADLARYTLRAKTNQWRCSAPGCVAHPRSLIRAEKVHNSERALNRPQGIRRWLESWNDARASFVGT